MPFSFHPHQEAQLKQAVRKLRQPPHNHSVHLFIIQGAIGYGKTWLAQMAVNVFAARLTRILTNDSVLTLFRSKCSVAALTDHLFMGGLTRPAYIFICLDEWVNECLPTEMDKLIQWIRYLQARPRVPTPTVFILTCVDMFHGNAKKLWPFVAPPPKFKSKRKLSGSSMKKGEGEADESVPVRPSFVTLIRLYPPKDYILHKYVKTKGVHNPTRATRIVDLCQGDIRQLNLLIREPLALTGQTSAACPGKSSEASVFQLVATIFEGGARSDVAGDQRVSACVESSLQLLNRITCESTSRIQEFIYTNRTRISDQNASLGFEEEARSLDLLRYHATLSEDLSCIESTNLYDTHDKAEQVVRACALRSAQTNLQEYELDDSVKIMAPRRNTTTAVVAQQRQCRTARNVVFNACFWRPGEDPNALLTELTRANPQPYLDFINMTVVSADCNYMGLSDRLQTVPAEDVRRVFPRALRQIRSATSPPTSSKPTELFVPF